MSRVRPEFQCENCSRFAVVTDGKDQWCGEHQPPIEDHERFDIRPVVIK